jgi:hypothetical protein
LRNLAFFRSRSKLGWLIQALTGINGGKLEHGCLAVKASAEQGDDGNR